MGRPGCGITDSAVEAQTQAMISQPQCVGCRAVSRVIVGGG
jgi:cytochrome c551/c552